MNTVELKRQLIQKWNGLPAASSNDRNLYEWIKLSEKTVSSMDNPQCFVFECMTKPKKEVQRLEALEGCFIPMIKTNTRNYFDRSRNEFLDNLSKKFLRKIYYRSKKNPDVQTKLVRNFFALEGDGSNVIYHLHAIIDIPQRYSIEKGVEIVTNTWKETTELNQSILSSVHHSNFNNDSGDFFKFSTERKHFQVSSYIGYSMKKQTKESGIYFTDNFSV